MAGAFADVQFGDIRGTIRAPFEQYAGISSPGWFMKTEYRFADYGRKSAQMFVDATGAPDSAIAFKPTVQTLSFSLVYRFNEAGGTRF